MGSLPETYNDPKKPLDITQMRSLLQNIVRNLSHVPAPLLLVGQESVTNP